MTEEDREINYDKACQVLGYSKSAVNQMKKKELLSKFRDKYLFYHPDKNLG